MREPGAWGIHIVLIIGMKIFYDTVPGVSQETSWTLTNISYMMVRVPGALQIGNHREGSYYKDGKILMEEAL